VDVDWRLTRFEVDNDTKRFVDVRPLTEVEVGRIRWASGIVGTMTRNNLIGPLVNSSNRLACVSRHVLESPNERWPDTAIQAEWGMALDEWLMHLVMFRRRTEREVRRVLGEEPAAHAAALFQDLYTNNVDFRFCWEWRNAAQHTVNPLTITRINGTAEEIGQSTNWTINTVAAAGCGYEWPEILSSKLAEGPDCDALVASVLDACNRVGCEVFVNNAEDIEAAADLLFALWGEALRDMKAPPPSGPVSVCAFRARPINADATRHAAGIVPFRYDLAADARLSVDNSREYLGQSRKRT
jgi:hypothetical protein